MRKVANVQYDLSQRISLLAIDGGVIAGALIFLTISSVAVVLPSNILPTNANITEIYKAVTTGFALAFIAPFAISAVCIIGENDPGGEWWMTAGFIIIPVMVTFLAILYLLAGEGYIAFIPAPAPH